jgi:hypothetical protein
MIDQTLQNGGNYMKKVSEVTLVAILILGAALLGGRASPAAADEHTLLHFNTMVGVPASFTAAQNPIRGINGGGLPWMLTSAAGRLSESGRLELVVHGLVLAAGANAGSNPIANFKVIVSCLTTDGVIDNETSELFPASTGPASSGGGNAQIQTTLTLPSPCIAPIVFVTSPGGAWFAATGR